MYYEYMKASINSVFAFLLLLGIVLCFVKGMNSIFFLLLLLFVKKNRVYVC